MKTIITRTDKVYATLISICGLGILYQIVKAIIIGLIN